MATEKTKPKAIRYTIIAEFDPMEPEYLTVVNEALEKLQESGCAKIADVKMFNREMGV